MIGKEFGVELPISIEKTTCVGEIFIPERLKRHIEKENNNLLHVLVFNNICSHNNQSGNLRHNASC